MGPHRLSRHTKSKSRTASVESGTRHRARLKSAIDLHRHKDHLGAFESDPFVLIWYSDGSEFITARDTHENANICFFHPDAGAVNRM